MKGFKKKQIDKSKELKTETYHGSLCLDQMSSWYPVEYDTPEIVSNFLRNGEKIIAEKIKNMNLDRFNFTFFDEYIDQVIKVGLADVEQQRNKHQRTLNDIRLGQQSMLSLYKMELRSIESELQQLKSEVLK